jgi:uncharacterized protein (TIGR00251 family)
MALRLRVRLTPKGGRDAIEGWWCDSDGREALKARVAAPPEDGKANTALMALIARALDVKKSEVRIAAGASSRLKTVEIDGDERVLAARLDQVAKR